MFYLCRINVPVIHIRMELELNMTAVDCGKSETPEANTAEAKGHFCDSYFSFVSLFAIIATIIFIFTFNDCIKYCQAGAEHRFTNVF